MERIIRTCCWNRRCCPISVQFLATSSFFSRTVHPPADRARETGALLQREVPAVIAANLRPPNSPNLNRVVCSFSCCWRIERNLQWHRAVSLQQHSSCSRALHSLPCSEWESRHIAEEPEVRSYFNHPHSHWFLSWSNWAHCWLCTPNSSARTFNLLKFALNLEEEEGLCYSLRIKHLYTRKNARKCTIVKPIIKKIQGEAMPLTPPSALAALVPTLSYTHF